jgi:hypothetical protein
MSWKSEEKAIEHEKLRIAQAEKKAAGDDAKFRGIILLRATRCGPEKRKRFIEMLYAIDRNDLAAYIQYCFKERSEE